MSSVLVAVIFTLAGGTLGGLLVPKLADLFLKRAYSRSCAWWWDSYRFYCAFRDEGPCREPLSSAAGEEGALGMWRDDALRAIQAGGLSRERVCALRDAGLVVDASAAVRGEAEQQERCTFSACWWQRSALAVGVALGAALLVLVEMPMGALVALALCGLFMAVAAVCDLRARMLPLECCVVVAIAGAAFQIAVAGWTGLVAGAVFGAVVGVGCLVVNRLMGRSGGLPVGWGDARCMVALSLATGAAAPVGFAACYASAAACALAGIATHKLSPRDGIPMAPFLAVWLMCASGVLVGV